jgi:hypothetical protein
VKRNLTASRIAAKLSEQKLTRERKSMTLNNGTLRFEDGTVAEWEFVEYVPYEPSAYHWDEGIIVSVMNGESDGPMYFISLMDGHVYRGESTDEESLTAKLEGVFSPEVNDDIERRVNQ